MKPEEKQFFVDLLAPLRDLPESLSTSLAPLRDLPSVLRVLAGGSSQDLWADPEIRVAELAGLEPIPGERLEGVVRRVIALRDSDARLASDHAAPHELEIARTEGAAQARAEIWRQVACAAGVSGDAVSEDAHPIELVRRAIESAREQGRIEAFVALVHAHSLEVPDGGRAQDVLNDAIVAALEAENAISKAFDAGREQGRASGIKDVLTSLASRAGAPEMVATEDRLADLLREGIEAGKPLREVRERAASGALLALLDDVLPGVRHERTGLGKVEDLVNGELRSEIARRVGERSATDAQDERPGLLAALRAFGGRADEGCETWTVDGLRLACANLGLAYRRMEDQCSVQVTKDVYDGLILQRDAYMQQVFDLDRHLRGALDAHEIDHTGANALQCVELLIASRDTQAQTLGEAEQAYDAIERALRTALHNAGVSHVDSDALQCVELLVASRNAQAKTLDEAESAYDRDHDALAAAQDTIAALDRTLRPAVAAAGVPVEDATVLDLAERLVIASRTVVANETEMPRSARDGSRKTIREIIAALGLDLQTDHLTLPKATAALVQALQGIERSPVDSSAALQTLGVLATALNLQVALDGCSVPEARDAVARAVRALVVNARHEELERGRQIVINAVCEALACRPPNQDESLAFWAIEVAGKGGADTARERAIVIQAVRNLGGDDAAYGASLEVACTLLDDQISSLKSWARDNLPILALWDAVAVQDCPLPFERARRPLDGMGKENPPRDVSDAHEDEDDWRPLARDLRSVVDGDDVTELAAWLRTGQDVRALIEVALDRVAHLENEVAESDDRVEVAKGAIADSVEELARALWERLPRGVNPDVVGQLAHELAETCSTVSPASPDVADLASDLSAVERALRSEYERAQATRDLASWCALSPAERNRLVDRTRDALAAVNG